MAKINMTVVLDEAHIDRTEEVSQSLTTLGVQVEQVLSEIGVISAAGDDSLLESVRAVEGVEEARQEHTYQLPPFSERTPQ